jgi:cytochrome c-type biogenesis protein CcmH/NrfG
MARGEPLVAALELTRAAHLAPEEPDILLALARVLDRLADPTAAAVLERYLRAIAGTPAAKSDTAEWARTRLGALAGKEGH